jgi:hypothetical protein
MYHTIVKEDAEQQQSQGVGANVAQQRSSFEQKRDVIVDG